MGSTAGTWEVAARTYKHRAFGSYVTRYTLSRQDTYRRIPQVTLLVIPLSNTRFILSWQLRCSLYTAGGSYVSRYTLSWQVTLLIRSAFIIYPILSVEIELIGPFLVPPSTRVVNTSFQSLLFCEQRTTCTHTGLEVTLSFLVYRLCENAAIRSLQVHGGAAPPPLLVYVDGHAEPT